MLLLLLLMMIMIMIMVMIMIMMQDYAGEPQGSKAQAEAPTVDRGGAGVPAETDRKPMRDLLAGPGQLQIEMCRADKTVSSRSPV